MLHQILISALLFHLTKARVHLIKRDLLEIEYPSPTPNIENHPSVIASFSNPLNRGVAGTESLTARNQDHDEKEKRDDQAFTEGESEHEYRDRDYALLDSNELNISPQERLLRVAAAYRWTGIDKGDWASKWSEEFQGTKFDVGKLSDAFVAFASGVKFGNDSSLFSANWVRNFDIAYRKWNRLGTHPDESIVYGFTRTRGTSYSDVVYPTL